LKWTHASTAVHGGTANDPAAARLAAFRRRRLWTVVVVAQAVGLIAAVVGSFFIFRTRGVQVNVELMRNEVGEALTMMTIDGAGKSFAKHIPKLIDTTARWDRKFAGMRESFRGLDKEIDQVQAMRKLGEKAEQWRKELEVVSPMQRSECWLKGIKQQVEAEQKKWPNRTHTMGASEWAKELLKEFHYGVRHGFGWPVGIYQRLVELIKGERALDMLEPGDRLRYILFPYKVSSFTILRLAGIVIVVSGSGYLLCWLGLKSGLGWLSYAGLIYFLYLLNIALFILYLEVTK